MNVLLIFGLICLVWLLFRLQSRDTFTQEQTNGENNYEDNYKNYKLDNFTSVKPQRYLTFLSDVNDSLKSQMPRTGAYRGSCDDKLNERIQNEALTDAYTKLDGGGILKAQFARDPCFIYANHLCELTDPSLYLVESKIMAPRWLVNTYKNQALPTHVSLNCFNSNYDCCKRSQQQRPDCEHAI
uniref:Uncharacterized protein n=1 Tax=viral metagenome TaxID=1070528 RepID=A0A6C0H770_9ZZZZ